MTVSQIFTDISSGNYLRFNGGFGNFVGFQVNSGDTVIFNKNTASLVYEALGKALGLQSKVFRIGHIDVDSGETIYTIYGDWKTANEWVKTYQRNAIVAWHCDETLEEV
jgi:hypothetical protein